MKTKLISTKKAYKAAREHFNRKRLRNCRHAIMGGNNPYHLFIFNGSSFEIR